NIGGLASRLFTESGVPVPMDVIMNPTPIVGARYQGGSMTLVRAGTSTPVGSMVSSEYQGAFYGPNAVETAGSFQLEANHVPIVGGGGATQNVQAIGVFGGRR